jgi:hypothetical protein
MKKLIIIALFELMMEFAAASAFSVLMEKRGTLPVF